MFVLGGARRVLEPFQLLHALAAYHRWHDVWRLAEFLHRFCPECRLLRWSHDSIIFDAVSYGIT